MTNALVTAAGEAQKSAVDLPAHNLAEERLVIGHVDQIAVT
jgi:hypothetical protein